MNYTKGHTYNVCYIDKKGNSVNEQYTPDKDVNIVNIIKYFKDNKQDFLKLKEVKEESKMIENKSVDMITNLYDYLEATDFEDIDITDMQYDMLVAFCLDPEQGDSDNYDKFLTMLAKDLEIQPITQEEAKSKNLSVIPVNMYKWVEDNFDKLDSIFDVSGESKEDEIEELIHTMEALISGGATDSVYTQLTESKCVKTESEDDEFEELEPVDVESVETEETEEAPVDNTLEGTGEDQTETAEDVANAIENVEQDANEKDVLAVDTSNSSLDVLIADENSAIDGYNAFLNQSKQTLIPSLYEVLEKEINEIIADEQDHINKLSTIKLNFKFDSLVTEQPQQELQESDSDDDSYYTKIVKYFRNKGMTDNEIAIKILDDVLQVSPLEFALDQLDEDEAEEYYNELAEVYESKCVTESIKNVDDLEVGDEVTIPYARGPVYTEDESRWVKGKVISIDPVSDHVDLEVPTTLTVTKNQLSNWLGNDNYFKESSNKTRGVNKSNRLNESVDVETAVVDSYYHLLNDIDKPASIEDIYDDVINNYDLDDIGRDLLDDTKSYEQIKRTIISILNDNNLEYDLEESKNEQ